MSENGGESHLKTVGTILGVIVGVITIVLAFPKLIDLWPDASFDKDIDEPDAAVDFVEFLNDHPGDELKITAECGLAEDAACIVESADLGDRQLVWVCQAEPCVLDDVGVPPESAQAVAVWIGVDDSTNAVLTNGADGAGSIRFSGKYSISDLGNGGAIFPAYIRSIRLDPV
jgi:hypothetical protein